MTKNVAQPIEPDDNDFGATPPIVGRFHLKEVLVSNTVPLDRLQEFKIGDSPALFMIVTDFVEEVKLHWESDPSLRGYFHCPGDECPYCKLGIKSRSYYLLPIYGIGEGRMQVVRVPSEQGPHKLASLLLPLLEDPQIDTKMISAQRDGNKYLVETLAPGAHMRVDNAHIKGFLADYSQDRFKLASVFPVYPPHVLQDVPHILNKLTALGLIGDQPSFGRKKGAAPKHDEEA